MARGFDAGRKRTDRTRSSLLLTPIFLHFLRPTKHHGATE
jgi:hypothetical protein